MLVRLVAAAAAAFIASSALAQAPARPPASPATNQPTVPQPLPQPAPPPAANQPLSLAPPTAGDPKGASAVAIAPTPVLSPAPAKGSIVALDAASRELLQKINVAFNALTVASGEFVQVAPDGSRTQGQFYLQKPGKIRFDYDDPTPIEFISDGGSIAVRDRKLATQDITPLSQTPLRFLLADKIDLLRDAPVIAVQKDVLFVTVVLEERHPVAGTHRLLLMFDAQDFQLRQWTVTDPQGYDTTVAIYNIDTTRRPRAELFKINYERVLQ